MGRDARLPRPTPVEAPAPTRGPVTLDRSEFFALQASAAAANGATEAARLADLTAQQAQRTLHIALDVHRRLLLRHGLDPSVAWALDVERLTVTPMGGQDAPAPRG